MQNLDQIIRDLSEIYDKKSLDTFITVYQNKNSDEKFIKRRENACFSLLESQEKQNFKDTIEQIKEFLNKNKNKNLAVFASSKHDFFKSVELPVEVYNALIVDSSPYIRPLARIQDEWESFTLVLLNSNFAKIYSISLGQIDKTKNISKDIMNRHKKGGQSQARFQRLRKGAIHSFFKEVEEALQKFEETQIILAGPGTAKTQFKDMLPKHLQEKIVDIIDIGIESENELFDESIKSIIDLEGKKSHKTVERLKAEILKDGLAVYGIEETKKAVETGQAEILVIQKDYKVKGCLCENCQILNAGPVKECPVCGGPTTEADVLEEILEFAKRTDAEIEFTDDEFISQIGHVGAILRYKQ